VPAVEPTECLRLIVGDARALTIENIEREDEIGIREADGLGALERVGGRGHPNVGLAAKKRRDTLGEGRLDDLGLYAEGLCEIVAGVDVEADRIVVGVTGPHRRKIESHRAAQLPRIDDVVELVRFREPDCRKS
jgi:hypothetical protein